ncbi:MAG: RecX family transcriptional regulator [Prevotella sp.]|nr:RecX family transcriptional regulator [Prevotella sp.]MBQ9204250.1 RecX family transcriptional regulator [Prevotella sp.]
MKRRMTEETAMFRLADYCAKGEHCSGELLAQMAKWEIPEEARMRIMKELQKRRYFDDERYTQAFVNDKIRYTKWGRRKIEQALWQKHISQHISQQVLDAVDDADYVEVLKPLLRQRSRTIKANSDYERNQKLVRFALGRGYTMDIIRQCIDADVEVDDDLVE